MGVNIDEILASLEETEKTAEAKLAENLSDSPENVATPSDETSETGNANDMVELTDDDMAKIAAECDSQGRIMARSFVDEINSIAATDYPEEATTEAPAPVEKTASEEYDPAAEIIGTLYNNYFGEEE